MEKHSFGLPSFGSHTAFKYIIQISRCLVLNGMIFFFFSLKITRMHVTTTQIPQSCRDPVRTPWFQVETSPSEKKPFSFCKLVPFANPNKSTSLRVRGRLFQAARFPCPAAQWDESLPCLRTSCCGCWHFPAVSKPPPL